MTTPPLPTSTISTSECHLFVATSGICVCTHHQYYVLRSVYIPYRQAGKMFYEEFISREAKVSIRIAWCFICRFICNTGCIQVSCKWAYLAEWYSSHWNPLHFNLTAHFDCFLICHLSPSVPCDKWVPAPTAWCVLGLWMEEQPTIWRIAANILNKQSRTADKEWSSSLGVGQGANNSSTLKCILLQNIHRQSLGPRLILWYDQSNDKEGHEIWYLEC